MSGNPISVSQLEALRRQVDAEKIEAESEAIAFLRKQLTGPINRDDQFRAAETLLGSGHMGIAMPLIESVELEGAQA